MEALAHEKTCKGIFIIVTKKLIEKLVQATIFNH